MRNDMSIGSSETRRRTSNRYTGATVVRITDSGLAYVAEAETKRAHVFCFDKIQNYRGQTPEELGLRVGQDVTLTIHNGTVRSVEVPRK